MAENDSKAPPPAPHEEESQLLGSGPEAERAAPAPRKERRRGGHGFTLFLATIGLLATALGVGAVVFKNRDERLRALADAIEQAAQNPKDFIVKEKEEIGAWLAEKLPHGEEERKTRITPPSGDAGSKPTALAPPPAESAPGAAAPGWSAPPEVQQKPPERRAAAEPAPQSPAPSLPPPAAVGSAEIAPLLRRLEALEAEVRAANDVAAEARRAAEARPPAERIESPAAAAPETKNAVAALEARLEELSESMAKLQEQLQQPKVGTRATPDVDAAPRAQPAKALTALESLALAQAVQRALERAKPFGPELAALRRLGADPKALAALAPFAEKGAPTPRDLLGEFEPIGKTLRAFENKPPEGTPLTEKLMHEAQRLVHLRSKAETSKPTADDLTPKIEKALARDDLAGALQAFAALPEATRAQAREFGETLAGRRAAEEAAAALVTDAIGDLDAGKN
jgi:hypothetical protein